MNKDNWWNEINDQRQVVSLSWTTNSVVWWNEQCAKVLEVFGLPGDRFYYTPYVDHMTFKFKNIKDADLCRILLSESL